MDEYKDWSMGWYCVRSKPRMETTAAASLAAVPEIEAYLPRTQRQNSQIRQPIKPLFPGYFFARFDPVKHIRNVQFALGVAYVVRRNEIPVHVPSRAMIELRLLSPDGILEIPDQPHKIGDEVKVISGLFQGDCGKVTQLIPSRERIKVLFEILGRATEIEIDENKVEFPGNNPISAV